MTIVDVTITLVKLKIAGVKTLIVVFGNDDRTYYLSQDKRQVLNNDFDGYDF